MRIKHRYAFNTNETKLTSFLDKQGIKREEKYNVSIFYMYEDEQNFDTINNFMKDNKAVTLPTAVYTKKEIETATWLTVRSSWQSLYPQPQDDMKYKTTTYDDTDYCEGNPNLCNTDSREIVFHLKYADKPMFYCGKGLIQKDSFAIKKEPNWGSRNFMMLHWVFDELFISPKAEEVLRKSDLKGFEIYDVFNKSKKKLENVKQIFVKNYVDEGFCADAIERTYTCPVCGFKKYWPKTGAFHFHKEIFTDVKDDIVKTTDKFGEINCESLIFITQKFYQTVTDAKLDRGLVFEPIELI